MTNPTDPTNDYALISNHFRNAAVYDERADAAVYIEGEEDEYFWRNVLKYAKPERKYKFYYNSNLTATTKGEHRSGSGECVKFYPHTDTEFIVCVDTDYNYLLDSHTFSSTDFVFQTYTYSIENHYCFATNLQDIILDLTGQSTFDFNVFLAEYSEIVYELFVLSVLSEKKKDGQFSINDFQKTGEISRYPDLSNNGLNELNQLQTNVKARELILDGVYTPQEINAMKQTLSQKVLTPQTTYLFIKGHGLIDLEKTVRDKVANNINNKLLDHHRRATKAAGVSSENYAKHLQKTLTYTGYWQMDQLVNDIKRKI